MTTGCPERRGFSDLDPLSILTSSEEIQAFLEEAEKERGNPDAGVYSADCRRVAAAAQAHGKAACSSAGRRM